MRSVVTQWVTHCVEGIDSAVTLLFCVNPLSGTFKWIMPEWQGGESLSWGFCVLFYDAASIFACIKLENHEKAKLWHGMNRDALQGGCKTIVVWDDWYSSVCRLCSRSRALWEESSSSASPDVRWTTLWNIKDCHKITRARLLCLFKAKYEQSTLCDSISLSPILLLSSYLCLGLQTDLFLSSFLTKTIYAFLFCAIRATSHPSWSNHSNNRLWQVSSINVLNGN